MLLRFARLGTSRPWLALVLALLVAVSAGLFGATVAGHLSSGGLTDQGSPSSRADALMWRDFRQGTPNLVLLVTCPQGVDSPAARLAGVVLTARLAGAPGVGDVVSYWLAPGWAREGLESRDGRSALVTATVLGSDNVAPKRAAALAARLTGPDGAATVTAGGQELVAYQISQQISHDLTVAEAIAVPLTLAALVLVFGSPVAALLPLFMGVVSVLGALAVLRLLTLVTPISIYGLNLTTAMGLGLGIDYSLFILSRYREELELGNDGLAAVHAAVVRAGRTVLYSSVTVGLSMTSLLFFPFYLLRSFAFAGLPVIAIAAFSAIVVLPALLCLLGRRVNSADVRPHLRRLLRMPAAAPSLSSTGFWHRQATMVMRRPLAFGGAVVVLLVALGAPFLSVRFGFPDDRVLPASASSHQVGDVLRADFDQDLANNLSVLVPDDRGVPTSALARYAQRLSRLEAVSVVTSAQGIYVRGRRTVGPGPGLNPVAGTSTYLTVENDVAPYSAAGRALVHALRSAPAPAPVLVTGLAARSVDALHAIGSVLPYAMTLIASTTFVVLLVFSGGLLVPVKALVLNILSLSATFGAMVWVFQDGHLSWLLGPLHATGYIEPVMPVLMFCIAFGVSMDYEIFLVSRIKEEWDRSERTPAANTAAVAWGLERTGRIVTAAAALLSIVFIALATSQINFIKLLGSGLALAVLMDATLVRGILVPAFMRVAGRANWWSPAWLSVLLERPDRGARADDA